MTEADGNKGRKDVELSKFLTGIVSLPEGERLRFAKQVLFWLALICVGVIVGYAMYPDNRALGQIFEWLKICAPPLATLVFSFYFPSTK
jgi:hypothetical protein